MMSKDRIHFIATNLGLARHKYVMRLDSYTKYLIKIYTM
jgi:hypothetical protein